MRTMKTRSGREPTSAKTWRAARIRDRIPAARDGRDASPEHGASAEQDAGHAVAALYQLHYPALVRLTALLVPDLATAEDIVQDAFAAVHGWWHMLPDTDAALAYLRWSVVHRSRSVPPLGPTAGTGEPRLRRRVGAAGALRPPTRGGGPSVPRGPARGRDRLGDRDEHGRRAEPHRTGDVVTAGRTG